MHTGQTTRTTTAKISVAVVAAADTGFSDTAPPPSSGVDAGPLEPAVVLAAGTKQTVFKSESLVGSQTAASTEYPESPSAARARTIGSLSKTTDR